MNESQPQCRWYRLTPRGTVDQQHVKYFMDLKPGKKQVVSYSVTYKRRKVGPE